jgi:hypothetical protein
MKNSEAVYTRAPNSNSFGLKFVSLQISSTKINVVRYEWQVRVASTGIRKAASTARGVVHACSR